MRLKPIPPPDLSAHQRPLFDRIEDLIRVQRMSVVMAREDGALIGPFNSMLHFPHFGNAVWDVHTALAKHSTLPKPVHELAILVTGARHHARYELYAHEILAEQAGLSQSKIAALAAGGRPCDLTPAETAAFNVASALTRGFQLSETTYQAAVAIFGEQGTAELIYLVGFYCLISVLLNGYDVAVPEHEQV